MRSLPKKHFDQNRSDFFLSKPNQQDDEIALWKSYREGNREALNSIFEKYARLLYKYGRNMTPDGELISDCIRDIFVELWIKREMLAGQISSIKCYLIKTNENL